MAKLLLTSVGTEFIKLKAPGPSDEDFALQASADIVGLELMKRPSVMPFELEWVRKNILAVVVQQSLQKLKLGGFKGALWPDFQRSLGI